MFFKRLSRGSRSNSYVDDYPDSPREKPTLHDSPRQSTSQHNTIAGQPTPPLSSYDNKEPTGMYRTSQAPQDPYAQQQLQQHQRTLSNGLSGQQRTSSMPVDPSSVSAKNETAPDLLTRAFNEALRPHQERVEQLEGELANLQAYVEQLEQQRSEIYSWIDKRGLRPGLSPYTPPKKKILTLHH
jgi:DNA-binding protein YbaB